MLHDMCNMALVNCIYNIVFDAQFHKFHGRPFARVLYLVRIHERYRSVTPLGATRVNRTITIKKLKNVTCEYDRSKF